VAGLSYQERKAKGLAKRAGKSNTGSSVVPYSVGSSPSMLEGMAFYVENLTGLPLEVEFVGRVITIKAVK